MTQPEQPTLVPPELGPDVRTAAQAIDSRNLTPGHQDFLLGWLTSSQPTAVLDALNAMDTYYRTRPAAPGGRCPWCYHCADEIDLKGI